MNAAIESAEAEEFFDLVDLVQAWPGALANRSGPEKEWPAFPLGRFRLYGQRQRLRLYGPRFSGRERERPTFSGAWRIGDYAGASRRASTPQERAKVLSIAGRWDEALEAWRRAEGPWAAAWRGALSLLLGRGDGRRDLERAAESGPWARAAFAALVDPGAFAAEVPAAAAFLQSEAWLSAGRPEAALSSLRRGRREDPHSAWALVLEGECRRRLGHSEAALADWRAALALDPAALAVFRLAPRGAPEAALWDGHAAFEALRYGPALSAFRRTARRDPRCAAAWAYLGRQLGFQGRPKSALAALERAASLTPDCGWIHAWRGLALRGLGRPAEALEAFSEAIRLAPRYVGSYAWRGALLRRGGRLEEALWDLDLAVELSGELDTGRALAFFERKETLWALGFEEAALADMRRAARLDPKFAWSGAGSRPEAGTSAEAELSAALARLVRPELLAWRGRTRLSIGRADAALADLDAAVAAAPEDGLAWAWRGQALIERGRALEGEASLERAIALEPEWAPAWSSLALARARRGDVAAAAADLDRAVALDGSDASTYLRRAQVRGRSGRLREAIEDLDRALALDRGFSEAKSLRERLLKELDLGRPWGEDLELWRGAILVGVAYCGQGRARTAGELRVLGRRWGRHVGPSSRARAQPSPLSRSWRRALRVWKGGLPYLTARGSWVALLERETRARPGRPWTWRHLGLAHYLRRDFAAAAACLEKAIALDPGQPWDLLLRGDSRFFGGDVTGAREDFQAARRLAPRNPWCHALLGRLLYVHGGKGALRAMERACALEPGAGWLHAWRAESLGKLGRDRASERAFALAARLDPKYDRTFSWRGLLRLRQGRPADAVRDETKAVALNPLYELSLAARARARWALGDAEGAYRDLKTAAAVTRESAWVLHWLDLDRPDAAVERSLELLDALSRRFPRRAWPRLWAGQTRLLLGRWTEALADLETALELSPGDPWALAWKGKALLELGRTREALACLKPGSSIAWSSAWRGLIFLRQGRFRAAERCLDRAIAINAGNLERDVAARFPEARAWRAQARLALGRWNLAEQDLREAVALRPEWKWAYVWLARLCAERGAAAEALEWLRLAFARGVDAYGLRGELERLLGNRAQARLDFAEELARRPTLQAPRKALEDPTAKRSRVVEIFEERLAHDRFSGAMP